MNLVGQQLETRKRHRDMPFESLLTFEERVSTHVAQISTTQCNSYKIQKQKQTVQLSTPHPTHSNQFYSRTSLTFLAVSFKTHRSEWFLVDFFLCSQSDLANTQDQTKKKKKRSQTRRKTRQRQDREQTWFGGAAECVVIRFSTHFGGQIYVISVATIAKQVR